MVETRNLLAPHAPAAGSRPLLTAPLGYGAKGTNEDWRMS